MPYGTLVRACALSLCLTFPGCQQYDQPEILVKPYTEPQELPAFVMPRPSPEPPIPEPDGYAWSRWLILIAAWPILWIVKRVLVGKRRLKKVIFTTKGKG